MCDKCPNFFDTKALMEQHLEESHSSRQPKICKFCFEKFQDRSQLKLHLNEKHIQKNYQCSICSQNFRYKHKLYFHKINLHGCKYCCLCKKIIQQNISKQGHFFKCKFLIKGQTSSSCFEPNFCTETDYFLKFFDTIDYNTEKQIKSDHSSIQKSADNQIEDSQDYNLQELSEYLDFIMAKEEENQNLPQYSSVQGKQSEGERSLTDILPKTDQMQQNKRQKQNSQNKQANFQNYQLNTNNQQNSTNFINMYKRKKRQNIKEKKKMKPIQFDDILVEIINIKKRITKNNNIFHIKRDNIVFYLNGQIKSRKDYFPFVIYKLTYVKIQSDSKYNFQFDRLKLLKQQNKDKPIFAQIKQNQLKTFLCTICNKIFYSQQGLQQHICTHNQYQLIFCQGKYKFKQQISTILFSNYSFLLNFIRIKYHAFFQIIKIIKIMQEDDVLDIKILQQEIERLKNLTKTQQHQIQKLQEENEKLVHENSVLQGNFIKIKDSFSKELLERSNIQSETDNNESIRENHIDIFNDLKHSNLEEKSMKNVKLFTSNVKEDIKNNLSFNEKNDEEKIAYSANISEFRKSGSLTKKKLTNCKIKNTKYDEFIDNLLLRDKKDKINYLMDLCAPRKQDIKKLGKQKSLSQSTSNSFLKVKDSNKQSTFYKIKSSRIFEKSQINYELYVHMENLKNNYGKLVNEFYIIDCPKSKLKNYMNGQLLDFQISYSSHPKSVTLTEEKIKFFTPFEKKIRHICVENRVSELNINLFSDDLQKESQQFFCVALNSNQTGEFNEEDLRQVVDGFPILQKCNPDAHQYFYILEIEDFWVDETDTINLNKFINFYCHPKYYVIQTYYPFTVFFKKVLTLYSQQIKKKRLEKFIKIITKDQVDLPTISRIDSFNMLNQEIEIFTQLKEQLFEVSIQNNSNDEKQTIKLSFFNQQIQYQIPEEKFLQYAEAELDFVNLLRFFTYEEFLFIYLNIIQEKNVVFVSKDSEKLSAAISTFSCLLKPFQWPFPKIYSLPKDCLMMISSPVPVLIGLRSEQQLILRDIIPAYGNVQENEIIYVFLDDSLIYYNLEQLKDIIIPLYDDFVPKLKKLYMKYFNKKNSNFLKIVKNKENNETTYSFRKKNTDTLRENFLRLSKGLQSKKQNNIFSGFKLPSMRQTDVDDPNQFFHFFKYFFNQIVIQKLPRNRKLLQRDSEEYIRNLDLQFFSKSQQDISFLKTFVQSQIFVYYLEKYFVKNLQLILNNQNQKQFFEIQIQKWIKLLKIQCQKIKVKQQELL